MPMQLPDERRLWFHPLLFAVFPALSLLAANIDQVPLMQGLRMALVSLLLGLLVYAGFGLALRHGGRAALAASLTVVALLTYGRLYDGLKAIGLSGETIVRHRYLLPAWLVVVAVGIVWCARRTQTAALNRVLNLVGAVSVAFPILSLAAYGAGTLQGTGATGGDCTLHPAAGQALPDVYIIVMDAYERDDVLREFHGYDNSPFLQGLEDMGFYVAYGSLSNYRHTELSLSSMLNMEYIQDFPERFGARPQRVKDITELIRNNRVRQELECLGYFTVAFETGHIWTEWRDADYFLQRDTTPLRSIGFAPRINRLEYIFLKTTLARASLDSLMASRTAQPPSALDRTIDFRERVLFVFRQLEDVPTLPSPKLVLVHILSPHPPFVFGPDGEPVSAAEFETDSPGAARDNPLLQAYADQVTYLNKRLLQTMQALLAGSERRPIVLLMGDHGWAERNMEDKLSILNAYLVPPEAAAELGPTITPVNSFRVIFDAVFGGSLGQLPNVSYFSTNDEEFEFVIVPNSWSPGSP